MASSEGCLLEVVAWMPSVWIWLSYRCRGLLLSHNFAECVVSPTGHPAEEAGRGGLADPGSEQDTVDILGFAGTGLRMPLDPM